MEAMRSLILLHHFDVVALTKGFAVVFVLGGVMAFLNIRTIRNYD